MGADNITDFTPSAHSVRMGGESVFYFHSFFSFGGAQLSQMQAYLLGTEGDMVERGLILVAIVVAAVALWFSLGNKLAAKLGEVTGSF